MKASPCDRFSDQLLEYADGELFAAESARIAEHLAACPECRETVAALRKSLQLAGAIWSAGEAELATARVGEPGRLQLHPRRAAFIAASIVLLAGASLVWLTIPRAGRSPIAAADERTVAEMRLAVERAGTAMQMLGAAEYLSEQDGGAEIAQDRFRYIIANYPETAAAAEARSRLESSQRRL